MNISAFFERVGLESNTKVEHTYDFIKMIQYHSVTSIPYENIDIVSGLNLSLKPEDIFNKIVVNHRGGYCFELNALISHLYKELGFKVNDYPARYLREETQIPMRRHRVMTAALNDGEYLCDIGVGQKAPRYPLKVEEDIIQSQFGEAYKMEKSSDLGWVVYDWHNESWRSFFSFTCEKQYEVDFNQASYYFETHPDSKFNKDYIVTIKTLDGRKTLNGREFKVFVGDKPVHIEENISDKRLIQVLSKEFKLNNLEYIFR